MTWAKKKGYDHNLTYNCGKVISIIWGILAFPVVFVMIVVGALISIVCRL